MTSRSSSLAELLLARKIEGTPRIAVVAPSFAVDPDRLEAGCAVLESAGIELCRRDDLVASHNYLAGDDARRADELSGWIADPSVDAILCARGGYGAARILSRLDPMAFGKARKPLIGFSDVTALLLWQRATSGLVGFHGPMFDGPVGPTANELECLLSALRGEPLEPMVGEGVTQASVEGPLVGGSLTLIANSLGTPWEVDSTGAILMIEEIGERPYAIDRHLQHLADAGKLEAAAGFAVGHLVGCSDPKRDTPTAETVVGEVLGELGKPLVTGLPFGHQSPNLTWPMGVRARLDAVAGTVSILGPAVA